MSPDELPRLTWGGVHPAGVSKFKAPEAAAGANAPSTATVAAAEGKSGSLCYRFLLQQPLSQVSMLPQLCHTSAQIMVWFHRLQDEVQLACVLIVQPGQSRVTLLTACAPTRMRAMCLHGCNSCWRSSPQCTAVRKNKFAVSDGAAAAHAHAASNAAAAAGDACILLLWLQPWKQHLQLLARLVAMHAQVCAGVQHVWISLCAIAPAAAVS